METANKIPPLFQRVSRVEEVSSSAPERESKRSDSKTEKGYNWYSGETQDYERVSGEKFLKFFNKKRLKLALAGIAGWVGVMGNYYAVKFQIEQTRFDMISNPDAAEMYAFGVTVLLDLMIVVFHLMRIPLLIWTTTISAIVISLYANINVLIQGQTAKMVGSAANQDLSFGGGFLVSVMMAALPIVTLTYLMHLVMDQFDEEMRRAYSK